MFGIIDWFGIIADPLPDTDAPAFDVSKTARRRLRIPSVFTISKSKLPCGRSCRRDERSHRGDPVSSSGPCCKDAPYTPPTLTCQTLSSHFFSRAIKGMDGTEKRTAEPPPLLSLQLRKTIETEGAKDVSARFTAFATGVNIG